MIEIDDHAFDGICKEEVDRILLKAVKKAADVLRDLTKQELMATDLNISEKTLKKSPRSKVDKDF